MSLQPKRRKLGKSTHKNTQETTYQTHTVEKGILIFGAEDYNLKAQRLQSYGQKIVMRWTEERNVFLIETDCHEHVIIFHT